MALEEPPVRAGEPAADAPVRSTTPSIWSQIKEVLIGFLPGPVRQIIEKGLLRAFLIVVFVFVILPPLVTLLAAFWLKQLAKTENSSVRALRTAYLEVIQEGFSIEEVASRSNVRLDYFQLFEYDLRPKVAPRKELRISIQPNQKAAIDFKVVSFNADAPDCTLPEGDLDLVTVSLGEQPIRTLRQDSNVTSKIDKKWWQQNLAKFDFEDLPRLSFTLTDRARELSCGRIHIEGSVLVFKDLFPTSAEAKTQ